MRVFLFILLSLLTTKVFAHETGSIHISGVRGSGNGCAPGTFSYLLNGTQDVLQVLFSDFVVTLPGTPVRSCNLALELHLPAGYSVSWYRTEHRGFVDTSGGAAAEFSARYFMQGSGGFDMEKNWSWGPLTVDAYTLVNDQEQAGWSRCGGVQKMTVNTKIRLKKDATGEGFSTITVDDQSQRVVTRLYLSYRRC